MVFPFDDEDPGVIVEFQNQDVDGDVCHLVKLPSAALLIVVDKKVVVHNVAAVLLMPNEDYHQLLQLLLRTVAVAGCIVAVVLLPWKLSDIHFADGSLL